MFAQFVLQIKDSIKKNVFTGGNSLQTPPDNQDKLFF
jgi:hypothetical protein